jgi:hypothetical protein
MRLLLAGEMQASWMQSGEVLGASISQRGLRW